MIGDTLPLANDIEMVNS